MSVPFSRGLRYVWLRALEQWDRGFESYLRHGYRSAFFTCCAASVGARLVSALFSVRWVLPICLTGFISSDANSEIGTDQKT